MGRPANSCCSNVEDAISKLPDDVLHKILSHLTTKSAVKTSILSKRWHCVWASTQILEFDHKEFVSTSSFIRFVDRALALRDNSNIHIFKLCWHRRLNMRKANGWLHHAMRHNVRELDLDIKPGKNCALPDNLFQCQSLKIFRLKAPKFTRHLDGLHYTYAPSTMKLPCDVNLSKIRTLVLYDIVDHSKELGQVISRFPLLEFLWMTVSWCDVELYTPNLKYLALDCDGGCLNSKFEIFAPKLIYFSCGLDRVPKLMLKGVDEINLVNAWILCRGQQSGNGRKLLEIINSIRNTRKLILHEHTIQLLYEVLVVRKQSLSSFCNLKRLVMETQIKKDTIQVMGVVVQSCPSLEELVIENLEDEEDEVRPKMNDGAEDDDWIQWKSSYKCSLTNLKEIQIVYFVFGNNHQLDLVTFLLQKLWALPKMHITYVERFSDIEICIKIMKKLKSFALSSGTTIRFTGSKHFLK